MQGTRLPGVSVVTLASLHSALTGVTAIVRAQSARAIFATPVVFAKARVINTLAMMGAIIRAIGN